MIKVNSIVIPVAFKHLCSDWHVGQGCMLYAVSSTGGLTIGIIRPRGCDSDEKWYLTIWRELSSDIGYTHSQVKHPGCAGLDDLSNLSKFQAWVWRQIDRLEESYGLADWDACDA